MSPQTAHTAFYVHTHGCEACEDVRVRIGRGYTTQERMVDLFTAWAAGCCDAGKDLLRAWYKAGRDSDLERQLEAAVIDFGSIT